LSGKASEDKILKLIQLVDQDFRLNLSVFYFSYPIVLVTISFIVIYGLIAYSVILPSSIYEKLVVVVTFSAFAVTLFSLMYQFGEEYIVNINFKRIKKMGCVEKDEKPLLKALIKMKAKNPEFDLEHIYTMRKDMFTKEKLLEKLYECTYSRTKRTD
jgi:hypothetical protein